MMHNGVSVHTSPTVDTPGSCWPSMFGVSFIFLLPHGIDKSILNESKSRWSSNDHYLFVQRRAKSNHLTEKMCTSKWN